MYRSVQQAWSVSDWTQAGLWGFARSARLETQTSKFGCVDIETSKNPVQQITEFVKRVVAGVSDSEYKAELALRENKLFVPRTPAGEGWDAVPWSCRASYVRARRYFKLEASRTSSPLN